MGENLSLLSFWGLVFLLIAVTLFVVIYSYQKSKYAKQNIVDDLRQRSVDVYLAAKTDTPTGRRVLSNCFEGRMKVAMDACSVPGVPQAVRTAVDSARL
jgi:hypothetical protein